jgi:agmatinase
MDPAVMPGTSAPLPGGIAFDDAADLLTGLARRGRVAGINVAEHYPSLDVNGITAIAITRLLVNLMGAVTHEARHRALPG